MDHHTSQGPAVADASSPPTLMDRLKQETRDAHMRTEAIAYSSALMQGRLPVERFAGQLAAYRIVHEALEGALARSVDPTVRAVWSDDLAKTGLLEADLRHFAARGIVPDLSGLEAARRFAGKIDRAAATAPETLLGTLYVLEGSTLGAAVLRKPLSDAFGLQDEGLRYHTPYGPSPMPHWKLFRERMNAAMPCEGTSARHGAVIASAREAFEQIGEILAALSQGLARA